MFVNGLGLLGGNLLVGEVRERTAPAFAPTYRTGGGLAVALLVFFLLGFPRAAAAATPPAPLVADRGPV